MFDYTDTNTFRFKVVTSDPDAGGELMGEVTLIQEYNYVGELILPGVVTFVDEGVTYTYELVSLDQGLQYQWEITVLQIPKTLRKFDESNLDGCKNLRLVHVDPENQALKSINGIVYTYLGHGEYSLSYCPSAMDHDLVLPDDAGIVAVGPYAFETCNNISSVTLPYGVRTLSENAFTLCNGLEWIYVPATVDNISWDAFSNNKFLKELVIDSQNPWYVSVDMMLFDKGMTKLIRYLDTEHSTVCVIPDSVITISDSAFIWATNLTKVVIPDSVISIGEKAFYECTCLEEVSFGKNVLSLGKRAFCYCSSLKTISMLSGFVALEDSTFYACFNLTSIVLPDTLVRIDPYVFAYCSSLREITMPAIFDMVGENAFHKCESLEIIKVSGGGNLVTFYGDLFLTCSDEIRFESGRDGYSLKVCASDSKHELYGTELKAYRGNISLVWKEIRDPSDLSVVGVGLLSVILLSLSLLVLFRRG